MRVGFVLRDSRFLSESIQHYITTNLVGGLGNQLFLVANLLATAKRNGLTPVLPPEPWSSSCEAPRPTYWDSVFSELYAPDTSVGGITVQKSMPKNYFVSDSGGGDAGFRDVSSAIVESAVSHAPSMPVRVVDIPESRPLTPISISHSLPPCSSLSTSFSSSSCTTTTPTLYRLVGFFQSSCLFEDYKSDIVKKLAPWALRTLAGKVMDRCYKKNGCRENNATQAGHQTQCLPHVVGMHIRRGDYTRMRDVFAYLTLHEYYTESLFQLFGGLLLRPRLASSFASSLPASWISPLHLLVFCEEEDEAKEAVRYFRTRFPTIHVSHCHPQHEVPYLSCTKEGSQDVQDGLSLSSTSLYSRTPREVLELFLLAHCDDIIMANSTFSWWSAYLRTAFQEGHTNDSEISATLMTSGIHRVVAPSSWFVNQSFSEYAHLYEKGWLII